MRAEMVLNFRPVKVSSKALYCELESRQLRTVVNIGIMIIVVHILLAISHEEHIW